jgi:hypothetical protein
LIAKKAEPSKEIDGCPGELARRQTRGSSRSGGNSGGLRSKSRDAEHTASAERPRKPGAGFTRTLITKSERTSVSNSLLQRTENLAIDGDSEVQVRFREHTVGRLPDFAVSEISFLDV